MTSEVILRFDKAEISGAAGRPVRTVERKGFPARRPEALGLYSGVQTDATFTRERGHPARRSVRQHAWQSGAIPRRGDVSLTAFALSRPWRAGMPAPPARRSHSTAHRYRSRESPCKNARARRPFTKEGGPG